MCSFTQIKHQRCPDNIIIRCKLDNCLKWPRRHKLYEMGEARLCIGLEISSDHKLRTIHICNKKYIIKLLEWFEMEYCKEVGKIPINAPEVLWRIRGFQRLFCIKRSCSVHYSCKPSRHLFFYQKPTSVLQETLDMSL